MVYYFWAFYLFLYWKYNFDYYIYNAAENCFRTVLDKCLVSSQNVLSMEEIKYKNNLSKINNSGLSNIGNNDEDELGEDDRNEISK